MSAELSFNEGILATIFWASRPMDPVDLVGSSIRLENMDLEFTHMDGEESDESDVPTKVIRRFSLRMVSLPSFRLSR